MGRLNTKTINTGSTTYNTSVTYVKGYAERETNLVSSYTNGSKKIQYSYDALKNIKSIVENGKTTTFTYNELNELVREDNGTLNKTITYEYDAGGNILSKKEYAYTTGTLGTADKTINYSYGDANWKDKLTAYDGKAITYDEIGNPLTYDGYTYTWEGGRRLKAIAGNNKNISYKYNDNGIRTEKTVNGVKTTYTLSGDSVLLETTGDEKIHYTYDSSNNLVSMNITSGSNPSINGEYFYIRNLQGDIIGLIDKNGTEVVSYTYDTWGKLISIEGSLKDIVGVKNPYRYRGYRYDTETGLYYLQSRYYNAEWGRFINADGIIGHTGELLNHNLFAYCKNNPKNASDSTGFRLVYDAVNSDLQPGGTASTYAKVIGAVNGVIGANIGSKISVGDIISVADTKVSDNLASAVVKSKSYNLDGTLGLTKYIKNPGPAAKLTSGAIKTLGALSVLTFGIGVADNFANYENAWERSAVDLGALALSVGAGALIGTLAMPAIVVSMGIIGAGYGISYVASKINDKYYNEPKRRN